MTEAIGRAAFEFDAFISYASEDATIVLPVVDRIEADGISVWIDRDGMRSGPAVLDQLGEGIERSAYVVAFVSDSYLSSNYTMAELQVSRHRDVADGAVRTIPVKLRSMTRELPIFDRPLTLCDLSDGARFDQEYARLKRSIRAPVSRPSERADSESVIKACAAPFEHRDEPDVALFLVRQAAVALERFLYNREDGVRAEDLSRKALHEALIASGRVPQATARSLALLRTFGDVVVNDHAARAGIVSRESIDGALAELLALSAQVFPGRPLDDRAQRVAAALPAVGDDGERQIPGTSLRLRAEPACRTSVGPMFTGRDAAGGEPRSIVLADLAPEAEERFLDATAAYARLSAPELVLPVASGIAEAGDHGRCPYVAFPGVRDTSVGDLVAARTGPLPAGPVYEIGLGVAHALGQLPDRAAHGGLSAHDVQVSRFGVVRLLALGPTTGTDGDETGLRALADLLRELLTGVEPAGPAPAGDAAGAEQTLSRLAECRSTAQAVRVLSRAVDTMPASGPSLRSLLPSPPTAPRAPSHPELELIESHRVRSLRAWPLAEGRVLTWEAETERLAVLDGRRAQWRDERPTPVRLAVTGRDGRVAVGGWNGAIRYFAGGDLVAGTSVDGAVGDLAFAGDELIAGSWRHALVRLPPGLPPHPLLEVARGVHRIAMAPGGERFAVADLSGRVAVYRSDLRTGDWRDVGVVSDLAFAGSRLVLLTADGLKGVRPDDTIDGPRARAGATRLLPGAGDDTCILLVAADPCAPSAPLEAWTIDHEDRQRHRATFPAGARVLSTCALPGHVTVALPGGGCAYWHDDEERHAWPTARAAELSNDGTQVVVTLPDRVDLYATGE